MIHRAIRRWPAPMRWALVMFVCALANLALWAALRRISGGHHLGRYVHEVLAPQVRARLNRDIIEDEMPADGLGDVIYLDEDGRWTIT